MGNYLLLLCVYFTFSINISNGCTINGVTQWLEPQHFEMKDTHRGLIISQTTSNIEGISLINFADGMNRGPYLELALSNSVLTITAKDEFAQYEEYETLLSIRFTVTFNCVGGTTRPLTYVFNIIDTNNHAPEFRPSDSYEFSLALPVPPGFRVSGCDYMIVRDIDLTTSRIDFDLRDNMYFEIVYFGQIQPKEFGAYIRTKTLITSLPETLSFDIHATDVDATNDDPLTSTAVVKIVADNTFRLPDPLTFSSAYFEADYTENNNLILREEYITLREGYDDQVEFHLEGVYAQYFNLVDNNNRLSFQVRSPLPEDISESQIFLVVAAEREFTSGASATVIVHLPRARELSFEEPSYRGSIENNQVTLENIVLKHGYTSDVNFLLSGDFSTYFTTNNTENLVTIDLRSNLPENILLRKNALLLTLSASGVNALTATTNVLLDIIKDDHVTPIFEKAVYNGIYNATTGLSLEEIIFIQGYDDSVDVILDGDQANLFTLQREGPTITLSGTIPAEIWPKQILIMTLRATKPRTVGANTVIQITLPSARELSFEAPSYRGSLENNKMSLVDIMLSLGYATGVSFHLSGEFSSYFTTNNTENLVMISLRSNLPENVLLENNVLLLTLSASGVNTLTATTNVLLDIIKDDHVTPIFEKAVYNGIYDATTGLSLEQIVFIQGYDNTVDVVLDGDQANFFTLNREGPTITLSGTIPDQIWSKQMLILTLRATKPRTVGANTVIQITLPSARYLNFEKSAYIGNLRNNTVTIEEIILSVGYSSDLEFKITGEHFEYFILTNADNILSISTNTSLSEEFIFDNNFIALTLSASGLNAITTSTTIVLEVFRHDTMTPIFSQHIYQGIYMNSTYFDIEDISLIQGYDDTVSFRLDGDHAKYFNMDVAENNVIINLKSPIPEDLIFDEKFMLFKVLATKDLTVGATAIVSVQFPTEMTEPTIMSFSQSTYLGSLMDDKFEITENIILETGFRPDTKFNLYGDYAEYFSLTSSKNVITIAKIRPLPTDQLRDIEFIIFQIEAQRERAVTASTSLIIEIIRPDTVIFPIFEKPFYTGTLGIEDGLRFEEEIRLAVGFDSTVTFTLEEDDSQWFTLKHISPNNISLSLNNDGLPQDMGRSHLIFSVVAIKENNVTGRSAIVISLTDRSLRFLHGHYKGSIEEGVLSLEVITLEKGYSEEVEFSLIGEIIKPAVNDTDYAIEFENIYYIGSYSESSGLTFDSVINVLDVLNGTIQFSLEGDKSTWFGLERRSAYSVMLILTSPIPPAVIVNNRKLIFVITAARPESLMARATIIITLNDENTTSTVLAFEQLSYTGSINNDNLSLNPIVLREGFTEQVSFSLHGELAPYFNLDSNGPIVAITLQNTIPEESIPYNRVILLELQASAVQATPAFATIVMVVNGTDDTPALEQLSFAETYYTGLFTEQDGLTFNQLISLRNGYNERVIFALEGDNSVWFGLERRSENSFAIILRSPIPPAVIVNNRKLIFVVTAARSESEMSRATVIITLNDESSTSPNVTFGKLLYNGVIRLGNVMHESIEISGFTGTNIKISGEYAELFEANLSSGVIVITSRPSGILPNVSHIALELEAGSARAVLLLNILEPDTPVLPTVTFSSSSYVLRVDLTHTGSIGQVQATSDNGEAIRYSLVIDEDHLRERLSIVNEGELRLSAPVSIGMYSFQVVATTIITQASATAPVHLSIEAATICDGDIVVPPLIILDRDEEEPHRNLVVLNQTGCEYTLTNIWPKEQSWLYVDEDGLHTTAIDREHESIAFMALSQIQVELILRCEGDASGRTKRSLRSNSTAEWLGPYEYGSNKWILTDTIQYNARRSLVNLIVNDINDNVPIFVGQENQPIVVGYPVPELEAIILPRALVELKATDADIGENAAIVYWSSDESLAVSPSTGFVHIRDSSNLQNNARFDVHATDQNGAGHTSNVEILIKLLERNRIAVLNIRNAFLEDEEQILSNISKTAGYEVKALRTVVISDLQTSRNMRASSDELAATLRLFVYGLIGREPVDIQQLIADINNDIVTVNVASIISLEDHLTDTEICILPERDNGLLAATIALSVLLFILIVAIAVWFFLTWRKNKNYEQFSDRNSTASRNISIEEPKAEIVPKPRLNIEELKRSERKLQDRLDAPVTDVLASSSTSNEKPIEAIINMATPDPQMPIIIQTIDKLKDNAEESEDDDEFGEKMKSRRKSVVTFNENVEKIIHVEDDPNDDTVDDYESFQF